MSLFNKILIANRGEIACRISRTCRRLGIATATVHSSADRRALHVREIGESVEVGGATAAESYLNIEAIVGAAQKVGATAVHPGIGFLSESAEFASLVERAGLTFIGPRPETMRRFADKWDAKREAIAANVPTIGGSAGTFSDVSAVEASVRELGFPVLLKAAAGGGGRGVRIILSGDGLKGTIELAMREAQSSFGRPDLLVEKFIDRPRHIEIQIAGDGHGEVVHLHERECSLQRRFQKIIEEAPAFGLSSRLRECISDAAVRMARQVKYRSLGTMEFLVAGEDYYFLECNPRLQVEHTVTESITGIDLVELQLRISATGRLPIAQSQVMTAGCAIQARIYAEDPRAGFVPSTGTIEQLIFPGGEVRVDTGVEAGSEVTPYYDAMIAKIVVHGRDRSDALARAKLAVDETVVIGVETNLTFLSRLLSNPIVLKGAADNRFIDREIELLKVVVEPNLQMIAMAAKAWLEHASPERKGDIWSGHRTWRLADSKNAPLHQPSAVLLYGEHRYEVSTAYNPLPDRTTLAINGTEISLGFERSGSGRFQAIFSDGSLSGQCQASDHDVWLSGTFGSFRLKVEPFLDICDGQNASNGKLAAPMIGKIIKVNVAVGDFVKANETLVVQESMKMELSINAPYDGKVISLECACGDLVERNSIVVTLEPAEGFTERPAS